MKTFSFYTYRALVGLVFWTLVIIPLLLLAYAGFHRIRYYMSRWWAYRVLWAAGVRLETANVVVAGGRGINGHEGFKKAQELADVLGGAVGARRVACDLEWYTEIPPHKDGMWSPFPDKPGLGLELDPHAVEQWSV